MTKIYYQSDLHLEHLWHNYASDLDYVLYLYNNIKAWICGHTHDSNDVTVGDCRCIINPYGYSGDNKNFDRNAHLILDNVEEM